MDSKNARSLWRHPSFAKLWSATTVSVFGDQFTRLALPLLAVETLHATAAEMGLLTMAQSLPIVLFGLLAGVWVDRTRRKKLLLVTADLGRCLLLASIPVAAVAGMLHLAQLYLVAFLVGSLTVFFNVAYHAILPSLIQRQQLLDGNSKLEASRSVAAIVGPGLAGLVIQGLSASSAIIGDAVSFVASAAFLGQLHHDEGDPSERERTRFLAELKEGLSISLGNPYLRALAGTAATANFFATAIDALYFIFATRDLGLGAAAIGLIFAVGSVTSYGGAVLARPVVERVGVGTTILGASFLYGLSRVPIAIATPGLAIPLLIAARAVSGLVLPISNVNQLTLRQAITPDHLQGRVNATMRFLTWWTIPIGGLAGGILGSLIGVHPAIAIAVLGGFAAPLWLLRSPLPGLVRMPELPG